MTDDEILCSHCNGTGEGQVDGARCSFCKGRGVEADPDEREERESVAYDLWKAESFERMIRGNEGRN